MQRRTFLGSAAIVVPAVAMARQRLNWPADTGTQKPFVVKQGDSRFGEKTMLGGKSPNDIKISAKDTGNQLAIFFYEGKEKGGPPKHYHLHQDEIFFIVSGEYLFEVGDEQFRLQAGDTIFLPRRVPHCFAQTSDTGSMYFMFQPAGKMEDFFRAMGALTAVPTPAQGAAIFAQHDMQVVGPPLAF